MEEIDQMKDQGSNTKDCERKWEINKIQNN